MMPQCGAIGGEAHHLACCVQATEPLTVTDPAPALDEAILDPGHQHLWSQP